MEIRVHYQRDLEVLMGFRTVSSISHATTAINFSYFAPGANPQPVAIHYKNGKLYGPHSGHPWHFFTLCRKGDKMYCEHMPWGVPKDNPPDWALSGGPLLVLDGKRVDIAVDEWNVGGTDVMNRRARVAIGLLDPWAFLVYVGEGEMNCHELANFFLDIGCHTAIAGDGGGSASMKSPNFTRAQRAVPAQIYTTKPALFKIAVDAGYGGADPGAVSGDAKEKDINLQIAKELVRFIGQTEGLCAVPIYMDDTDRPLASICNLANKVKADVFVSIHNNASGSPRPGTGWEIYHYPTSSRGKRLANHISKYMKVANPLVSRGIKTANFQVLRDTVMPAVLLECGFVDNTYDLQVITDPRYQAAMAMAVSLGVLDYSKEV